VTLSAAASTEIPADKGGRTAVDRKAPDRDSVRERDDPHTHGGRDKKVRRVRASEDDEREHEVDDELVQEHCADRVTRAATLSAQATTREVENARGKECEDANGALGRETDGLPYALGDEGSLDLLQ
jgi:hypothetical protein